MSWIFWLLLAVTLVIMILPFTGILTPAAAFTFWAIGSLFAVAAVIWLFAAFSRVATRMATVTPT